MSSEIFQVFDHETPYLPCDVFAASSRCGTGQHGDNNITVSVGLNSCSDWLDIDVIR